MSPENAWKATLGELELQMTRATFNTWLQGTRALSQEGDEFVVGVRSDYAKDWLEHRLYDLIVRTLSAILNRRTRVRFVVWSDEIIAPKSRLVNGNGRYELSVDPAAAPARSTNGALNGENPLNSRYTFSSFVVGPNNRLAHAAALSVAENPGETYNPLFLYGGVGLGKTHLLHAIGHRCLQDGLRLRYLSAEAFTNDLVTSLRNKQMNDFRDRYRTVDVLLVDDIQFLAGKEQTQEEFFHTFNDLHGLHKQVVVTSDRPPRAMVTLEERLRSRFEWGLTADLQAPDEETRRAILLAKVEENGQYVPDEVIAAIAHLVRQNIRELEGALNKVMAYAQLSGGAVDLDLVDRALADMRRRSDRITVEQVIATVCNFYSISAEDMYSSSRKSALALPRQVAMYLSRSEAEAPFPLIGANLGGRDHTTVIYGCDKIAAQIEIDPQLRRDVMEIKAQLYNQPETKPRG